MRILAIDFETANSSACSACSIGYCLWDNGEIVEKNEILIKPHRLFGYFDWRNIRIHGIKQSMVKDADEWPAVYESIRHCFTDSLVVAHNAVFDMGVLASICTLYDINAEPFEYFDSVLLSRVIHPDLVNHKLNTVCEYLNVDLNHHHAGSDALGCLAIVMDAMDMTGIYDPQKLVQALNIHVSHFEN